MLGKLAKPRMYGREEAQKEVEHFFCVLKGINKLFLKKTC